MLDEYAGRVKAQALGLYFGCVDKRGRCNKDRRDATAFKIADVVHTARRAASSIGERFDHRITAGGDLVAKVDRRWFGERRLHVPIHRGAELAEAFFDAVEEDVASWFGDVEKANGQPGK